MNPVSGAWSTVGIMLIAVSLFQFDPLIGQAGAAGQPPAGAGQREGGPGGRGFSGQPPANLPASPTAVTLPTMSTEVTGPGPVFDSGPRPGEPGVGGLA